MDIGIELGNGRSRPRCRVMQRILLRKMISAYLSTDRMLTPRHKRLTMNCYGNARFAKLTYLATEYIPSMTNGLVSYVCPRFVNV